MISHRGVVEKGFEKDSRLHDMEVPRTDDRLLHELLDNPGPGAPPMQDVEEYQQALYMPASPVTAASGCSPQGARSDMHASQLTSPTQSPGQVLR